MSNKQSIGRGLDTHQRLSSFHKARNVTLIAWYWFVPGTGVMLIHRLANLYYPAPFVP